MTMVYNPIRDRASYMSALGGNPHKVADFNIVWSSVSAIDLQDLIIRYNALELSGNIPALTTLKGDIDTALASIDALKHTYTDVDVIAPANDMRMRLSSVRSNTESRIRHYSSRLGKSKVGQTINTAKKGMNKVVKAYKKITKPANDLYDAVEDATHDGGASFFGIGRKH